MRAVWWRVRAGLRQDWRGLAVLALITALMGSVVLVALAGAYRTATAVSRFVQYAGQTEAQVAADARTMDKIAALPDVAYSALNAVHAGGSGLRRRPGGGAGPGDHVCLDPHPAGVAGAHSGRSAGRAVTR